MTMVRRPTKHEAALALRLKGASISEIADALDFSSEAQVRRAINETLAEGVRDEDRSRQRDLAARRLEYVLKQVWPKLQVTADGESDSEMIPAARLAKDIIKEIADLYGARAPQEVIITNPTTEQLMQWVLKVGGIGMPEIEEKDPFEIEEAEVVPDGYQAD